MEIKTKQIKDSLGEAQIVYETEMNRGKGNISLFTSALKNQEPQLTQSEAEKLFLGETVDLSLSYRKPNGELGEPSPCSIVPIRIEEKNNQLANNSFESRVLKIGVAWHMLKKEDQSLYGYRVFNKQANDGHGVPVLFFKKALIGDDKFVELSPKDCFELIEKGSVEVEGKTVFYLGEIQKRNSGESYKVQRARLGLSKASSEAKA
tara:strand:- start:1744 stop:2361 length:618 start_codon:yes stop_codon:yes gene_type:complete